MLHSVVGEKNDYYYYYYFGCIMYGTGMRLNILFDLPDVQLDIRGTFNKNGRPVVLTGVWPQATFLECKIPVFG
jgi:hypothetical protein